MNLAGKLTAISIQITGLAIALAIMPSGSMAQVQQVSQALSPEQINLRAKQITVRIDGSGIGSGVIISQSDNSYIVLTNWHVVKNAGQYTVQTIDGRQYPVNSNDIKQLSNLDLAIVKFSAKQNYQVADIGNSAQLIEGQNIYFTGYPGELRQEKNRYYRFFPASLVGVLPQSANNGYALVYNGEAFPGMSGGPVLDKNALLVGIHGEANIHALTGATSNYAIPINTYKQAIANNNANNPVATVPPKPAINENITTNENKPSPPEITVDTNNQNTVLSSPNPENKPNVDTSQSTSATNNESTPTPPEGEKVEATPAVENKPNVDTSQSTSATNNESTPTPPEGEKVEATPAVENKPNVDTAQSTSATNNESTPTPPEGEKVEATPSVENKPNVDTAQSTSETNNESTLTPPEGEKVEATQPVTKQEESDQTTASIPTFSASDSQPSDSNASEPSALISQQTGINYATLKDLLSKQKWSDADLQTNYLIAEIIKTAKRKKPHTFIELKYLTSFACQDIKTIDQLWQKYSEGRFGFSSQQQIWLTVNDQGDFSTETWRNFATLVGWKQGDIANSSGYLLYNQLTFDPQKAPMGHLPWWFASNEEQQNLIKHIFNRCTFEAMREEEFEEAKN